MFSEEEAQGVEIDALIMNLKNLFQRAVELAPTSPQN